MGVKIAGDGEGAEKSQWKTMETQMGARWKVGDGHAWLQIPNLCLASQF